MANLATELSAKRGVLAAAVQACTHALPFAFSLTLALVWGQLAGSRACYHLTQHLMHTQGARGTREWTLSVLIC